MKRSTIMIISLFATIMTGTSHAQNPIEEDRACDTIADILQNVSGSTMERYFDKFEDHVANKTRNGCIVKIIGSWLALAEDIHPPDLLYPNLNGPLF